MGGTSGETEMEGKNSAGGFSTTAPAPSLQRSAPRTRAPRSPASHVPPHLASQRLVSLEVPCLPGTVRSSWLHTKGSPRLLPRLHSRPRANPERWAEGLPFLIGDLWPVSHALRHGFAIRNTGWASVCPLTRTNQSDRMLDGRSAGQRHV